MQERTAHLDDDALIARAERTALVTGANRGIGLEIARQLAVRGWRVIMLGRDPAALEAARLDVASSASQHAPIGVQCDLASQAAVRRASAEVLDRTTRLDLLIHNAAIARRERHVTADGIEETLAVNHLAPFLMTTLLLPRMRETPGARIVQETTGAFPEDVDLDDLQMERGYDAWSAYQRSKLVNLAWALDLGLKLQALRWGVTMNAVLPGAFVRTDATREFPLAFRLTLAAMKPFMDSPAKAAARVVQVATAPELANVSGELFMKGRKGGEPPMVRDPDLAQRVREESAKLTGVPIEDT